MTQILLHSVTNPIFNSKASKHQERNFACLKITSPSKMQRITVLTRDRNGTNVPIFTDKTHHKMVPGTCSNESLFEAVPFLTDYALCIWRKLKAGCNA